MKYYKGWFSYNKNFENFEAIKNKISGLKLELIGDKNILESDLIFLEDAKTTILDCNRALKYIFIFQYYLNDEDAEELINNDLDILQNQMDSLLELVELDHLPNIMKIFNKDNFKKKFLEYKDHIISLVNSTENFKKNLIEAIQNNFYDKIDYDRIKKLQQDYYIYDKSYDKIKKLK